MNRESQGPDKLKNRYACILHHSGVRTFNSGVLTDYDCCCDPCLYSTSKPQWTSANWYEESGYTTFANNIPVNHCCKCNPRAIIANWSVDDPNDPCGGVSKKIPMFVDYNYDPTNTILGANLWAEYNGRLNDQLIKLTMSNFDLTPTGTIVTPLDESGCRWTLFISNESGQWSNYQKQTAFIDHVTTTCLSIPNITGTGLTVFETSGGSISLQNFDSAKIPFQKRSDNYSDVDYSSISGTYEGILGVQTYGVDDGGLPLQDDTIPVPTGVISPPKIDNGWDAPYTNSLGLPWISGQNPTGVIPYIGGCSELPKVLCVTEYGVPQGVDNKIYREFHYDTSFYPVQRVEFHPSYTGIESFATGVVLAKWDYTQIGTGVTSIPIDEINKQIYLYETYVDAIAEYSGDVQAAMASGSPKYIYIPVFEGNPYPVGKDDHVWIGGPYYSHPAIHYQDYDQLSDIQLRTEDENFYWEVGGATQRALFVGGFDYADAPSVQGSGTECLCEPTAYAATNVGTIADDKYCFVRPGRCSCWQYYCSDKCRCVPKNICFASYEILLEEETVNYYSGTAQWDNDEKCWYYNKGASGELSFCIQNGNGFVAGSAGESYNGVCNLAVGGSQASGYGITPQVFTCDPLNLAYSFGGTSRDELGNPISSYYTYLSSSLGDCGFASQCTDATPCYSGCGSHPGSLSMILTGFEEGEGSGVSCSETINLQYFEETFPTVIDGVIALEVECGYRGYSSCGKEFIWKGSDPTSGTHGLQIIDGDNSVSITVDAAEWAEFYQYCDPYEVYGFYAAAFEDWCCLPGVGVFSFTMEITEG